MQNPGPIAISTDGSRYDTRIDVFSGAPASASLVACDDDYPAGNPNSGQQQAKLPSFTPSATGTYYIMVSEAAKPTGSALQADGDLTPIDGPPFNTGTIPLAASAILNFQVTTTALEADHSSLNFPAQNFETTSAPLAVNLSAPAGSSIGTIAPQATGDFAVSSNNCNGATLTGSTTCSIQVTFKPTADGMRTGTLTISSNAVNWPANGLAFGERLYSTVNPGRNHAQLR